jgi:magnesium-transporting ATPase (P-type)
VQGGPEELDDAARRAILREQAAMADRGLRVLAFASRKLSPGWSHDALERDLVFQGLIGLEDPPRPEVPDAVRRCREAGIKVVMITGDHPRTAMAVARQIGLVASDRARVITSEELRTSSPAALQSALDLPEVVFARVSPDDKMRIVEALKRKQHVVAVTGDGVNDAPALKSAHIGIAMGICGTDVAKEAADMILLDDNFASIVNAVEEGRAVFHNIRKFLVYVLVHNVAQLVPYLGFVLFRIPLAITPIQILVVDMGTDSLTALGLGVERPDPQVMRLPPRPQNERLLTLRLALRAYLFLGLLEAGAAMSAFFFVLWQGGWTYGAELAWSDPLYLRATTACLSAIIVMQVVNVFLCRSSVRSALAMDAFGNPLILWGVVLELILLAIVNYFPWANSLLGTAPVLHEIWPVLVPFALAIFVFEETRKAFVRARLHNQGTVRMSNGSIGRSAPRAQERLI